jgi:hypothetical protein
VEKRRTGAGPTVWGAGARPVTVTAKRPVFRKREGGVERPALAEGGDEHRLPAGAADRLDVVGEARAGRVAALGGAERLVRPRPDHEADGRDGDHDDDASRDEPGEAERVPFRSARGGHGRILHSRDEADRPPGYGGPP